MGLRTLLLTCGLLLVGCGGTPAPPAPQPTPPPAPAPPGEVPVGPMPGAPGRITGRLDTPYARLADSLVFIEEVPNATYPPPTAPAVMDQRQRMFMPHVLGVLAGTTIAFPNTDEIRHSVYTLDGSPTIFDLGVYEAGESKQVRLETPGVVQLGCRKHQEMSAWIVVCQNPHFTLVPKEQRGAFELAEVPAGRWRLRVFHERLTPHAEDVTVPPGATVELTITGLRRR